MSTIKYIIAGFKGFLIGLVVGLGILFIGDSVSPWPARIADIIETPVNWLACLFSSSSPDGSPETGSAEWFFIFHFIYWGLLGVLFSIGLTWLREKFSRED